MRNKRDRKINFIKYLKILGYLILVIIIIYIFIRWPIYELRCESQFGPCGNETLSKLEFDKKIYKYNLKNHVDSQLGNDVKIQEYSYTFVFPFGALVNVIERKPQVALKFDSDDKYYFYSKDGYKVGSSGETELPVIHVSGAIEKDNLSFITELSYQFYANYNINEIYVYGNKIEFVVDNYLVVFPLKGDIDLLLGSFELTLSWLKAQSFDHKISLVDFRYENPILKLNE